MGMNPLIIDSYGADNFSMSAAWVIMYK
jgi:hypothetical protein